MSSHRRRRLAAPLFVLVAAVVLAACGRPSSEPVRAGADPAGTAAANPARRTSAPDAPTTLGVAVPAAGATGRSPVPGLTPGALQGVVAGATAPATRSLTGPTVDRVVVAATTYWRIRIPGSFPARGARVRVVVGGRSVGLGFEAPDLDALVAVTAEGTGLVAGASVTYQWEGSSPVAAGRLAVIR